VVKATYSLIAILAIVGCSKQHSADPPSAFPVASTAPVSGPFNSQELVQFTALNPIDTHTHIYQTAPAFLALLQKLNMHVLDILVAHTPDQKALDEESGRAWKFVQASQGRASLCTTFDPFGYRQDDFAQAAIARIDDDFDRGAVAVKIWKNIGEQLKDANGSYILPDNPVFEPIYKNIAEHHKTLIAHVADPDTIWQAPNAAAPDYSYYMQHPEWYMYQRANAPSKTAILRARDHLLEENPDLRVVGAHLGSMEADLKELGMHLDRYPNFAVDTAARMPYLVMQSRSDIIAFIEKYQDRLIYATDEEVPPEAKVDDSIRRWENTYANDWRFLATNDILEYQGHKVQGLALRAAVLHKLYHDNAMKWFPGMVPTTP
jgi:predicted TIM-barrel fold metal-dependent hydrolase